MILTMDRASLMLLPSLSPGTMPESMESLASLSIMMLKISTLEHNGLDSNSNFILAQVNPSLNILPIIICSLLALNVVIAQDIPSALMVHVLMFAQLAHS